MKKSVFILSLTGVFLFASCKKENPTTTSQTSTNKYNEINTNEVVLMGAQYNVEGSFYSTSEQRVYKLAEATGSEFIQSKIDFAYYYGMTYGATIGSTDNSDVKGTFPKLNTWTKRNNTVFEIFDELKSTDLDKIKNDSIFKDSSFFVDNNTKANGLIIGQMVKFKTVNGKRGVFKVKEITSGKNSVTGNLNDPQFGQIKLIVKVEK